MRKLGVILVGCGLLGLGCGRAAPEAQPMGRAVDLQMEQVRVRAWVKNAPLFAFQAAQVLLDEDGGELDAEGVRGRMEQAAFAEAKP